MGNDLFEDGVFDEEEVVEDIDGDFDDGGVAGQEDSVGVDDTDDDLFKDLEVKEEAVGIYEFAYSLLGDETSSALGEDFKEISSKEQVARVNEFFNKLAVIPTLEKEKNMFEANLLEIRDEDLSTKEKLEHIRFYENTIRIKNGEKQLTKSQIEDEFIDEESGELNTKAIKKLAKAESFYESSIDKIASKIKDEEKNAKEAVRLKEENLNKKVSQIYNPILKNIEDKGEVYGVKIPKDKIPILESNILNPIKDLIAKGSESKMFKSLINNKDLLLELALKLSDSTLAQRIIEKNKEGADSKVKKDVIEKIKNPKVPSVSQNSSGGKNSKLKGVSFLN